MDHCGRALWLALAVVNLCWSAKQPAEWRTATVVWSQGRLSADDNVAATSAQIQVAHEQFDLDAGDAVYTVEEWVVPQKRLRLAEGSRVRFTISGKDVTIETPDKKMRKLRLVTIYPRQRKNLLQ